jgi:hypothetical protein
MAGAIDNPSRRALLGAALGVPLLRRHCEERSDAAIQCGGGVSAGLLPPDQARGRNDEAWEAALAAFRAAEAAVRRIEAATAGYSLEEEEALLPEHEAACDSMEAALGRLLLVPAPDPAALGAKFEAAFAHELGPSPDDDPRFAALLRDIVLLRSMRCFTPARSGSGATGSNRAPAATCRGRTRP